MLAIIGSALSMLAPLVIWGIKTFVGNKITKQKYVKNYYDMINRYNESASVKVANYIEAEESLAIVQQQIREEQLIEPSRLTECPTTKSYDTPEIMDLDIELETHGQYLTPSKKAKGLVVHFTAGRFANGRQDAVNTLQDLAKRGYGCLVMDIDGQIYKSWAQDLDEIAWHAGESAYLGHKGLSRYCFGMEICNGGRLENDGKTWYNLPIKPKEQRQIASKKSNQKPGIYHKFTAAQEKSLIDFVLWQLDINPEFSVDFVIGHDECAPDRKNDPGGSLSMTMPDFRDMIQTR